MKMISGRLAARLRSALGRRRPAIYGVTGTLVGLTFAGVVVTRSWITLVALQGVTIVMLAAALAEVRAGRRHQRALQTRMDRLERAQKPLAATVYDLSVAAGRADAAVLSPALAPAVARAQIDRGDVLEAFALVSEKGVLDQLTLGSLRRTAQRPAPAGISDQGARGREGLRRARQFDRPTAERLIDGEIKVHSGEFRPTVREEEKGYRTRGRVLHVVGMSLPGVQTGYTLRTHYSAVAQRGVGVESHVVTQMGFGVEGKEYVREDIDGCDLSPGAGGGAWFGAVGFVVGGACAAGGECGAGGSAGGVACGV
jgi:hypothetical protein